MVGRANSNSQNTEIGTAEFDFVGMAIRLLTLVINYMHR